ncbi:hypothetical protein LCGC14_2242820 [marine sediment metagenome]|uniref:Uncharacterized protein n=1 Tax=marine sediment metagenome TaxID=412755 RepID=A0A0F9FZW1_9ZZZZ
MASTSFGLSSKYKVGLQKQIFELVYYTKGGITYEEAYFIMPVYLRQFHYNELVETLKKEAAAAKGGSTTPSPKSRTIQPPNWTRKGE